MDVQRRNFTPQTLSSVPFSQAGPSISPAIAQNLQGLFGGMSPFGGALSDAFRSADRNIFDGIRNAVGGGAGRLLNNPAIQSALGSFNPMQLLNQARTAAHDMGGTRTLSSRELSASRGERSFVDRGINAAFGQGGPGMNLVNPNNMQHREYNVSAGTQNRLNAAGQRLDQVGKFMTQADKLASKFGIDTTLYQRQGQVSATRTLAGDVNGPTFVGANASAQGSVRVGLGGLEAQGRAEAGIEARTGASGRVEGRYGVAEGSVSAQASAKASADGRVTIGPNGLVAEGNLYAGVSASAEASGRLESKPFATIGGVPMTVSAEGRAKVEAGAYAYANARAQATWNPPTVAVNAKAGAFAGARATAEGSVGVGPLKATGRAEAWAGIGAEANLDVGYKNGKLSLDFGIGAALGIGAKFGGKIEVDVGAIGRAVEGVAKDVAKGLDVNNDGKIDAADAGAAVSKAGSAIASGAKAVGSAVASGAKAVGNAVASGAKAVGSAVSGAVSSIGSFVKSISIF